MALAVALLVGVAVKREVTTIGEIGLRLTAAPGSHLTDATCFEADAVGAEANVAANLARLGRSIGWVGSLPDTLLGRRIEGDMRAHGVDTSRVVWMNDARVPLYYWERSKAGTDRGDERSVLCDTADSAFARLTPGQVDWDYLLNTQWLHISGIAMAISSSARAVVEQAVAHAHAAGVSVSVDVKYQTRQWATQEAKSALMPLLGVADLLFCTSHDAQRVFGLAGTDDEVLEGLATITSADRIVMPVDTDGLFALSGSQQLHQVGREQVAVDRAGSGDALVAGVLHGLLDRDFARGLAYGRALATLALSRRSTHVVVAAEELDRLASTLGPRSPDSQTTQRPSPQPSVPSTPARVVGEGEGLGELGSEGTD